MPNLTETEQRLRHTLDTVASSVHDSEDALRDVPLAVSLTKTPPAPGRTGKARRRSPLFVFAASFLAVLAVGAISILTSGTHPGDDSEALVEPGSAADPAPVTTVPAGADESSPSTTTPSVEPSAIVEFWAQTLAGWVDSVSRWDTFAPYEPEPDARVIESRGTGDPFGERGSIAVTVVSADDQLTTTAEYRGRGEAIDESALQAEIADLTVDGTTKHVDTIWYLPEMDSPRDEEVQADYFRTDLGDGKSRLTGLTALGRLTMEVEATDPSLLFTQDQQMGIATGMMGTSLEIARDPVEALTTEVEPLPEPTPDDWVALDTDLWIASVDEGEDDRLWVKTDIQDPTPANSSETRSMNAYTVDQFVVIVVGQPVPDTLTVTWDDGTTESVEPTWKTDLGMGFARFEHRAAQVVSVDGP